MQSKEKPRFTLKEQVTPLATRSTNKKTDLRLDANEDDDLYDPYSDYHDGNLSAQSYEEDPWR